MLPITFEKVQALKKTFDYNTSAGFGPAADKEGFKLATIINQELLPELKETRVELARRSPEEIISVHPEMADVIYRLDTIEKEVELWLMKAEKR